MPKGKPFPEGDEEEKTTIESQWEDEASTTVEQGDVAEKIRSLVEPPARGTGLTNTGAGVLDEPTVDDQNAQSSAITPVRDVARLQITAGNDAGNEIEIRPGKTYTIGRAIDNDVVLTDIAVSRKHFDLRFEDGAWVIVDRGSGNGTVVNGNLEDNPFMLANGDTIEIGNTVFRFDQPNAASRPERTVDLDGEDEEMSTVAGKPMRAEQEPLPPVVMRPQRPKTLPPPTPLRSAAASQPPPLGFPPVGPAVPLPASTLPMTNRAPLPGLPGVGAPTLLGDQMGMPMPTTIPGQGIPQQRPIYPYPQATEIPPHSVHAQMLLIQTQNRRSDGSTAHVPPTPYDGIPAQVYSPPQLTKRAKMVLVGIGLAVFAAVMTVAIVKSGGNKPSTTAATGSADKLKLEASQDETKVAAKTTIDEIKPPATEPAKTEPAKTVAAVATTSTKTEPTKTEPAKTEPTKTVTTTVPAPTKTVTTVPAPTKTEPTKTEPVKTVTMTPPAPAKTEPVKTVPTPKAEPVKTAKAEPVKTTKRPDRRNEARRDTQVSVAAATPPPRASGGDPDKARAEADRLYKAKKFNDASSYLSNQSKKFDEDVARDLRRTSDFYAKLGRVYSQGTAPGTRSTDAFEALRSASNYDSQVGGFYENEIQTKLGQVAPKAALLYVATKNFPAARSAMIVAQKFGAAESVKVVNQKLESAAGELYNEGIKELDSNPSSAKKKFETITQIVDPKSNWYLKAQQKLRGG